MRHYPRSPDTLSLQARALTNTRRLPFGARDRLLFIGVGDNEARINSKSLAANQADCNAGFDDTLENPAEHVALAEPLMADAQAAIALAG